MKSFEKTNVDKLHAKTIYGIKPPHKLRSVPIQLATSKNFHKRMLAQTALFFINPLIKEKLNISEQSKESTPTSPLQLLQGIKKTKDMNEPIFCLISAARHQWLSSRIELE